MKLLQVPDGLKRKLLEIADEIGDVYIDLDSCYGACDIDINKAKLLDCKKIIHYGHSKLIDSDIPVEYREMRQRINVVPILEKNFEKLKGKVGLVSTIQFINCLEGIEQFLKTKNIESENGGQILGCKVPELDVDSYLFVGSGRFHPLGITLKTDKPVFVIDVERQEFYEFEDKEKFLKQKYTAIALAKDAKKFGILVSTKPGQFDLELAKQIKEKLKGKSYILVMDEIKPEKLEGLDIDCYINTACPRIVIENRTLFKKPILNPDELENFK
jgi:2-(3-amino-3-carboxypropyl)histidine synthase